MSFAGRGHWLCLAWLRLGVFGVCLLSSAGCRAQTADVVTWWNSPQDKAALELIIRTFEAEGIQWQGTEIPDDVSAQTYVTARIVAGDPPIAAQWIDGATLRRLMAAKILHPVREPDWQQVLPSLIVNMLGVPGGYVGVPTGLRSRNWIWLNLALFKKAGIVVDADWPRNWEDVHTAARTLREAGITPFSIGNQPWEHLLTLEMIVASIGGLEFYRRAMIDLDDAALDSPVMLAAFKELKTLAEFAEIGTTDDADHAARMLSHGEAAMNIQGDWLKSTLEQMGSVLGRDFDCVPVPGTTDFSIVNVELFVFPQNDMEAAQEQQKLLADIIMDPKIQRRLNLIRGLTPARLDVPQASFDKCSRHLMENARRPNGLSVGAVRSMPSSVMSLAGAAVAKFLLEHLTPEEGVMLFRRTVSANR
jgi:glucose/mannose transport system substrate-binding protein